MNEFKSSERERELFCNLFVFASKFCSAALAKQNFPGI